MISRGTPHGIAIWIVVRGQVKDLSSGEIVNTYTCIDDSSVNEVPYGAFTQNVVSIEDSDIAKISTTDFEMAIGGKYDDVASNNEAYRIISNIQMFRGLGTKRLFALVKSLRIVDYEAGDIIFEKGVSGDTFYIIKEGEVDIVIDERIIRTFGQFEYFGERSVLFNQVRTATVKARTNIVLWELQQARF